MNTERISRDMTLLDIVHRYPNTEAVFRSRDEQAGECLLCKALFETIDEVVRRYGLDRKQLLADLEKASA
ncbi:MAG: hypothetical protein JEY79_06685 [Pseudodesulfovibrio sp.]|nr:hypothetical protein [Pseudodesulfovibrio sp.]